MTFENTGMDRQFLANVGRIADALEGIRASLERSSYLTSHPADEIADAERARILAEQDDDNG